MDKEKFDISLSFDKATYLDPQLIMFTNSIKDKVSDDVVFHIQTNRFENNHVIKYMSDNLNVKLYHKEPFTDMKSRCQYMFHCFEVETDKPWIIKMESDHIFLRPITLFNEILDDKLDLVLEPENRKIFPDNIERRLWNRIYRELKIPVPEEKITFRENLEEGLPLFGTGIVCVKTDLLDKINERWIPMTKTCEKWINYNIHPNEFAITAMIFDEGWKWKIYPPKYKFNPIGHFRKGKFPSTYLIEECLLPEDTIVFDYHRPHWLMHVAKRNPEIMKVIKKSARYIPDDWWGLQSKDFMEVYNDSQEIS